MQLGARESDYADQKQALDEMNERANLDVFVASFTVIRNNKTQRTMSYCVWSNHVDAWLPEADFVIFGDSDGVHQETFHTAAIAPWSKVQATMGRRMKALEYNPPRYEVKSFPTAAELKAFGYAPEFPKPR